MESGATLHSLAPDDVAPWHTNVPKCHVTLSVDLRVALRVAGCSVGAVRLSRGSSEYRLVDLRDSSGVGNARFAPSVSVMVHRTLRYSSFDGMNIYIGSIP